MSDFSNFVKQLELIREEEANFKRDKILPLVKEIKTLFKKNMIWNNLEEIKKGSEIYECKNMENNF